MTKAINYIVTATEVKTMVVERQPVADSQQSVIKTGVIGVTNNFYVKELGNDLATYTVNRLPRYQDIECPNSGLSLTGSPVAANSALIPGQGTNPIYNTEFTYRFLLASPNPISQAQTGNLVFTCTMPANITLVAFRAVLYAGQTVSPTFDYYEVTDFNVATGYVRIVLKKPVYDTNYNYIIAFNAKANQQYGVFSTTGYVDANYYFCTQAYTIQCPISFTLTAPNMYVQKQVTNSAQSGCVTSKRYQIDVQSTGGSVIGGLLTDTLPSGLTLDAFEAIFYDGVVCPNPTSDYYDITLYQQGQNAGSFSVTLKKEIGNQHYYTMWFYAVNNSSSATYTNTATYTLPDSSPLITTSGSVAASYTTLSTTRYYQLNGCNTSFAYTLIVPLGLNNRYILPGSPDIFTYGGAYVDQCTAPPGLNTSIQQTASYNCTDPTTTCNPTPNWVNTGTSCYGGCDLYYVQTDQNTCAGDPTSGTTRQGALITANSTSCGGCCGQSTAEDWQNNGSYSCYGTCNQYYIESQINSCAPGYPQSPRQGGLYSTNSVNCGGCCGQGPCCGQSTSQNQGAQVGTYYYCSNGNTFADPVYINDNTCYTGGDIYLLNGNWTSNNPSNGAPNVAPIWNNVGDPYCSGCTLYQNQVDTNTCSSSYGDPRDPPVDLGLNSTCGTWNLEYYCVGYDKWSRQRNSCTNVTCCDALVEVDSTYCGYVPPSVCRTYEIVGYNLDEYVDGTYTNCGGGSDSFSFYGGPGTVGSVCAQPSSVYITSGNGQATDVGGC